MSESWAVFFETEMNVFSLSPLDVGICIAIAMIVKTLIRPSGLLLLRGNYTKDVMEYAVSDNGVYNIAFRIIAPVFISECIVFLVTAISNILGKGWVLELSWVPVFLYWIIQLVVVSDSCEVYPIWTVLVQAVVSILAAIYFDWAVCRQVADGSIEIFDQSNMGWYFITTLFLAASSLVVVGIVSRVRRYNSRNFSRYFKRNAGYCSSVDRAKHGDASFLFDSSTEKRLFKYLREYGDLLPSRFNQDFLLKAFFLSVMAIEDANRPSWFRGVERFLFKTGRVRSTGIMQVCSERVLTDRESVKEAIPILERIWDGFLMDVAMNYQCGESNPISFSSVCYSYGYEEIRRAMLIKSHVLYGRYCGTYLLDISATLKMAIAFLECTNGYFEKPFVRVRSRLFCEFADILPHQEFRIKENVLVCLPEVCHESGCHVLLSAPDTVSGSERKRLVALAKDRWEIVSIDCLDACWFTVCIYIASQGDREQVIQSFPGWRARCQLFGNDRGKTDC